MSFNSWWGKPEYNGIKVLVLVLVAAGVGYFIYNSTHRNPLDNTGLVSVGNPSYTTGGSGLLGGGTTGTGATSGGSGTQGAGTTGRTTGKGTTGTDVSGVCDQTAVSELDPSVDNTSYVAAFPAPGPVLHFDQNFQDAGHFVITNPTPCRWQLISLQLSLQSTFYPAFMVATVPPTLNWQPIYGGQAPGSIRLHVGTTTSTTTASTTTLPPITFSYPTPTGPQFGASLVKVSNDLHRLLTFGWPSVPATAPVVIAPHSSVSFALEVGSWNTAPQGGTINMRMESLKAVNLDLPGTSFVWYLSSTVMPLTGSLVSPSMVTTSPITLVNP